VGRYLFRSAPHHAEGLHVIEATTKVSLIARRKYIALSWAILRRLRQPITHLIAGGGNIGSRLGRRPIEDAIKQKLSNTSRALRVSLWKN